MTRGEDRNPEAVAAFVERFAGMLTDAGTTRMAARVFSVLLTSDVGRLTAAELSERLQASPAAISGAVRYLGLAGMIRKEHEPGSRRNLYVLQGNDWHEMIIRRLELLVGWQECLNEGAAVLGEDTPAGHRMAESAAFFEFIRGELPALLDKWTRVRAERRSALAATAQ